MSSLPWICVVTLALLSCLPAQPVPKEELSSIISSISAYSHAIQNDKCWDDVASASYYTPVNVQEECWFSAVDCYFKELNTLVEECDSESEEVFGFANDLLTPMKELKDSEPQCSTFICEKYPLRNPKEFLSGMENLIQRIASRTPPSARRR